MKKDTNVTLYIATAAAVVLAGAGGFFGGIQYEKSVAGSGAQQGSMNGTNVPGGSGFGGRGGGFRRAGGLGTVTAISSDSITISETQGPQSGSSTATSKTYKITSSTTVTNNGSSASVSDIKTGDRVIIRTSSSDTTTATSIMDNPSFGGAPGGQTQSDGNPNGSDAPASSL